MIHRDIKPANIWLEGKQAQVKILDFGLARTVTDQTHLTQTGAILGTPAYMAPEQFGGKGVDQRADVFSLGCVLYAMCTGELPFKGADTMTILQSIATTVPAEPSSLRADLPPELADLIMRMLKKKAEERPASAQEVAEVLRTVSVLLSPAAQARPPLKVIARELFAKLLAKLQPLVPMMKNGLKAAWHYILIGLSLAGALHREGGGLGPASRRARPDA